MNWGTLVWGRFGGDGDIGIDLGISMSTVAEHELADDLGANELLWLFDQYFVCRTTILECQALSFLACLSLILRIFGIECSVANERRLFCHLFQWCSCSNNAVLIDV